MSTQASSGSGIDCTIKLPLRGRPPATIICKDSPTSTWINFLKDDVLPLLRENNMMVYHSPIGLKNAKAQTTT
jgi:hypothetical protein